MNNKITLIVVGVIIAAAFYGGMLYGQHGTAQAPNTQSFQQRGNGAFGGGTRRAGAQGGGFVSGDIISKDDKSITIKLRDGSTKIVFYSGTTQVGKMVAGTAADLVVGQQVTANGTASSDGTIAADMIQIRPTPPAGATTQGQPQ